MNVQQLRYLVAVSDFGSVSAAARSLGVTQPVISRSVHAFEVEHGVTVFGLSGTRLVITEEARAIVRRHEMPSPPSMPWDRRHRR